MSNESPKINTFASTFIFKRPILFKIMTDRTRILVTGAAGFIGFHLSKKLLEAGQGVVGLDNLNAYYEVGLKQNRLKILQEKRSFQFIQVDLKEKSAIDVLFEKHRFETVVHLAAQAVVCYFVLKTYSYLYNKFIIFFFIFLYFFRFSPNDFIILSLTFL